MESPSRATTSSFTNLPTELKLNIIEELYGSGTARDFTSALRVSQEWNELGTPLIWKYVAVSNDNLVPFVRSLAEARNTTSSITRNLSVHLNLVPHGSAPILAQLGLSLADFSNQHDKKQKFKLPLYLQTQLGTRQVTRLRDITPGNICLAATLKHLAALIAEKLGGLTSFSYRIMTEPADLFHHPPDIFDRSINGSTVLMPLDIVVSMLSSLPLSCCAIEVKTAGHEADFGGSEKELGTNTDSLCEALDRLLPYLKHLHLGGESISEFVFDSLLSFEKLPLLESLVLDTGGMSVTNRQLSRYAKWGPEYTVDATGIVSKMSEINWLRLQNLVALDLRVSYETGRFPSIKHLLLMELQQHGFTLPYYEWRVNSVDILRQRIEILPVASLYIEEIPSTDNRGILHGFQGYMFVSKHDGQLRFLDETQFDEGEYLAIPWASSTTGIRVPTALQDAREMRRFNFEWLNPLRAGMDRESFLARIRIEHSGEMAREVQDEIDYVTREIRAPYVVDGLLEWYD